VHCAVGRRQLEFPHHEGRRPTSSINVLGVCGPNDTPSAAIAELSVLPSLATSLIAFSLIASDLRRASRDWLGVAASCSWDARACSSSAWSFWSCSDKRLRAPSFSITLRMVAFRSYLTVTSCTTIPVRIKRNPATKNIESSPDMKQVSNQSRAGGIIQLAVKVLQQLGVRVLKSRHFLGCHLKLVRDLGELATCHRC
jgi:hypothetical protein